jgi:Bacterial type II and III secretion system protein
MADMNMMQRRPVFILAVAGLCGWSAWPALAQPPQRDLMVELRQGEEGSAGYVVGTQPSVALMAPQQIQVRNGSKASFSVGQSIPVQWVQSVSSRDSSLTVPGAEARSSGGRVRQALTWLEAGQRISVQPRWPGGRQVVTVEVEVQSAAVQSAALQARGGAELPVQTRSQLATTVGAPLGQWVTIATTGSSPQGGGYSSEAAAAPRRLLQLRVSAP